MEFKLLPGIKNTWIKIVTHLKSQKFYYAMDQFFEMVPSGDLVAAAYYAGDCMAVMEENEDLANNLSVAAHLIHGSSDGRFKITYCAGKLTEEEVRGAAFN